ncbi:ATP-binding protein [Paenibacillus senegalensis]|uniref:ATP-binding protein n=1 Tax=Paenibacillus senegalensis TaxID=1465766 RepID=UPI000288844D|nr:ATP-binding protein [Paenibacillus senegalensis]
MSDLVSRVRSRTRGQAGLIGNGENSAWKLVEQLISQLQEGVLVCERDEKGQLNRVWVVNSALCNLTGYNEEEYLAMDGAALTGHTRLALSASDWKQIDSGQELQLLGVWSTKNKEALPLKIRASSVELQGARLLLLVTQDRRNQEKLQQLEDFVIERDKRNSSMLKVPPEPILFHSEDVIIYANDAALQLLGAKWERELLGRSILDFVHQEDREIVKEGLETLQFNQSRASFKEYRMIRMDGQSIELEMSSIAVFQYMQRPVIQSMLRDVTEQRKRDRQKRQSDKLLAVSQLAAGLAHEMRNPLTAMKGFLQLMKSKSEGHQPYIDIMLTELERIHYTIGEFMVLARPSEAQNFKNHQLDELIQEVLVVMELQAAAARVELFCHVDSNVPELYCDGRQMKQVFVNIVKNAIEAMANGGGTLWIHASLTENGMIRLKFTDTGTGIEPEVISRLGEPFFTTKDNGSGLGLMVSNQILEQHEAKLQIHSEKNVGTTVWIDLPLQKQEE